ncbi:hypothetical protein [Sedimentitalea todarodis]|uniref:Uncharacterized protein n=1 Tax=Sedimentitalea todarodis TaxID=1631240 RepID=A0ABU3V7S8_9RHOB|nr:hypothetical protein [Sedimentitalea todarodis]MDU9002227.1 hypothetical protein [Sedimentitalea todarodis]
MTNLALKIGRRTHGARQMPDAPHGGTKRLPLESKTVTSYALGQTIWRMSVPEWSESYALRRNSHLRSYRDGALTSVNDVMQSHGWTSLFAGVIVRSQRRQTGHIPITPSFAKLAKK